MPKVTIEFKLPEEQEEYEQHQQAMKALVIMWDMAGTLRQIKHILKHNEAPDACKHIEPIVREALIDYERHAGEL